MVAVVASTLVATALKRCGSTVVEPLRLLGKPALSGTKAQGHRILVSRWSVGAGTGDYFSVENLVC